MKQLLILPIVLAACASTGSAPPSVIGTNADLSKLTGVWQGRIVSADASIAGNFEFRVTPRGTLLIESGNASMQPLWVRVDGDKVYAEVRGPHEPLTFEGLRDGEMDGTVWQRVAFRWHNAGSFSARREGPVQ